MIDLDEMLLTDDECPDGSVLAAQRDKTLQAVVQMLIDLTRQQNQEEPFSAAWAGLMLTGAMTQAGIPLKARQPQEGDR